MALVTKLESSPKERQTIHGPTRCQYSVVEGRKGQKYLQLDTLGSDDREIPAKVSQSIQFDRQAAGQLLQLLLDTFPDLKADGDSGPAGDESPSTDDDDEEAEEGRVVFRLHRVKERNPKLVKRKKRDAIATTGKLACEVCGFDFAAVYGPIGIGFAECHHRTPLSQLSGETKTKLSDLAVVCANCHRMLHRAPGQTLDSLRDQIHAPLHSIR